MSEECQYILKKGKNKGSFCLKKKCKHTRIPEVVPEVVPEVISNLDLIELLFNEFVFIKKKNLSCKTILIDDLGKEIILQKKIKDEISYKELARYCFHRFRFLKMQQESSDIKEIYYPINKFEILDNKLLLMNDFSFISFISDIKSHY